MARARNAIAPAASALGPERASNKTKQGMRRTAEEGGFVKKKRPSGKACEQRARPPLLVEGSVTILCPVSLPSLSQFEGESRPKTENRVFQEKVYGKGSRFENRPELQMSVLYHQLGWWY